LAEESADGGGPGATATWSHPGQTQIIWYMGCGSSGATMAQPMAMMAATMPSIPSADLSLAGLRLPAGSWATASSFRSKVLGSRRRPLAANLRSPAVWTALADSGHASAPPRELEKLAVLHCA
jgi:hypothetical protein